MAYTAGISFQTNALFDSGHTVIIAGSCFFVYVPQLVKGQELYIKIIFTKLALFISPHLQKSCCISNPIHHVLCIHLHLLAWHLSFPDFIKSIATLTEVLNGYPSIHFYQVPGEISWAGISWIEFKFSITIITKLFMWFTPQSIITGNYPAVIKHMLLKLSQIESNQTDKKMQIHCVDKRTSQPNERH